ncbi:MAG TPA: hypothetical protein VNZ52_09550, partial [Candidatus Thermoplasmatota archaeon]|nr:hypothetical protein [Candidatus Thermoplasmatota archaeon]
SHTAPMEHVDHLPRTGPFMGAKHVGLRVAEACTRGGNDAPLKALRAARDPVAFRLLVEAYAAGDPDVAALLADLTDANWERHKSVVVMFAKNQSVGGA